jgi:hypothetical protein
MARGALPRRLMCPCPDMQMPSAWRIQPLMGGRRRAGISSPRAAYYLGSADSSSSLLRTPSFT